MNPFGIGSAWSLGFRFVAGQAVAQAMILIGIGILAPLALQYAFTGSVVGSMSPMMAPRGLGNSAAAGLVAAAALAIGYILTAASYFATWRFGFDGGRSLIGAILYGLLAGLIATALIFLLAILVGAAAASRAETLNNMVLVVVIALIPLIAVFATFYTVLTAFFAAVVMLGLAGSMIFGAVTGNVGLAATLVGGSGGVVVLLLVLSALFLWLTARLSCTGPLMAARRSFNFVVAARDSWRLTWEEQWPILRYLALIGFGMALLCLVAAVALGASAAMFFESGGAAGTQAGALILRVVLSIPLAYLTVIVPVGIYRELTRLEVSADVFA